MLARLLSIFALLAISSGAWAQEAVRFPGSNWTIVPPAGFKLERTPGPRFENAQGLIITITDFDKQPVSPDRFGTVGVDFDAGTVNEGRLDSAEALEVNGRPAALANITLKRRKAKSLTLAIEGEYSNAMVSVGIPDKAGEVDRDAIMAALMSTREETRSADDRLADLPFVIGDMAGFHLQGIGMGAVALLTDGPEDAQTSSPEDANIMVMAGDTQGQQIDFTRDAGPARQRLLQQYPDAQITSVTQQDTDAGTALVIAYTRKHKETQLPLQGEGWFRMTGPLLVLAISEFPEGTPEVAERIARLRNSITAR